MNKEILYRFFEGTASIEEEKEVCDWAEASKENQEEYIRERKYFDVLLVHNRTNPHAQRLKPNKFNINNIVKYAAAIALFILCSLQIYTIVNPSSEKVLNTIMVPVGQRVNIMLSDGTNVWLNSGTKMEYPALFSRNKREIVLNGEAYFEVSKDAKRPFIVHTKKYNIKVLGTKFNVNAYNSDNGFSAALMEGSIQIIDKIEPARQTLLYPNQRVSGINGKLIIEKIENYDIYRWREGLLCLEHIAFNDLMKEFEKKYDIRIINENHKLDNYICSGKFRLSDGIDFILHVLQRDASFRFYRSKDNTTIYIK